VYLLKGYTIFKITMSSYNFVTVKTSYYTFLLYKFTLSVRVCVIVLIINWCFCYWYTIFLCVIIFLWSNHHNVNLLKHSVKTLCQNLSILGLKYLKYMSCFVSIDIFYIICSLLVLILWKLSRIQKNGEAGNRSSYFLWVSENMWVFAQNWLTFTIHTS
jgi:hypothetical protein